MNMRKLIAVAAVAASAAFTSNAVTKTYSQHGFTEVQNIAMDGLPSSTEITATPQLAFPGVTLDDIYGCQFITELYGGTGDGYENTFSARKTAYGIFPHRHKTGGNYDKMCLQFAERDSDGYSKFVILLFTNGEGGVYVQKYGTCYMNGMCLRYRFNNMDGSGNITFNGGDGNPTGSSTTDGGTYKAWGIRIHGMMPSANESRLAFPGATLVNLTNYMFIAQLHIGSGTDNPNYDEIAECVTPWPSSDDVQKIVMQFRNTQHSNRAAVMELTQGADGVYVRHKWSKNNAGATFTLDSSGNIDGSYYSTSGEWGSYCAWGLYGIPNYTYMQTTPMLLWTKKGGVLTLNDLAGASFTALFGGMYVNSGAIKNMTGATLVSGYNTRETVDANGNITEIVTEFEYNDSGKTVIVKFTNGEDGVYGQALAARWNQTFGYVYSDANGNYYGSSGNVATSRTAGGYGVCGLKAIADTAKIYRQGPTRTFAVMDMAAPTSSTKFPTSVVPGFSGLTLEDLSGCVFLSYMQSGSISGRYVLGKHPTLYPSSGDAEKLAVQFTAEDGSWKKSAYVQFAYNANGAVTIQKVQNTWTTAGNANNKYFNDNFFTIGPTDASSYDNIVNGGRNNSQYDLWGLQVFPGFVQTSPTLLFKGATLNDIENATFTARMAGAWLPVIANRVDGYNRHVVKDGDNVTSIVVEFQYLDGSTAKAVVVRFENGADGVYGTVIRVCWKNTSIGYQFVAYDGEGNVSGYNNCDNGANVAVSPIIGGYGVYDVQAAVEPDANEWTLDADRNWSYYTGGETFDDDAATIRVRVTANGATLTVDENTSVGKIVFVNAAGVDVTTNSLVVGSGASASIGAIEAGAGVYVNIPASLGAAPATIGDDATIAYGGDGTVSGVLSGTGTVEVRSGYVTLSGANDFTGGLVVRAGAVAVAGVTVAQGATSGPFGVINTGNPRSVTVEAGGMVDLNGHNGLDYRFELAGTGVATGGYAMPGPIVNFGPALDIGRLNGNSQQWMTGHAREYALGSDVTLGSAGGDVGVVSENLWQEARYACALNLGGYTLTKVGSGTLWLWSNGLSVSGNGTLNVSEGVVDIRKGAYNGSSSTVAVGANGILRIGAALNAASIVNNGRIEVTRFPALNKTVTISGTYSGTGTLAVLSDGILTLNNDLSVYDFVNNGGIAGNGTLTVGGTLTPGKAIPRLTLANGATVKLAGTNAVQSVTTAFAAQGTVNVDASAISDDDLKAAGLVPVLSAPSLPADIKQRFSVLGTDKRSFRVVTENGISTLYMSVRIGFTIFVR